MRYDTTSTRVTLSSCMALLLGIRIAEASQPLGADLIAAAARDAARTARCISSPGLVWEQ